MNMIVRFGIFVCVSLLAFAGASQPSDFIQNNGRNEETKPYLEVGPSGSYHGLIKENETTVEVTPPIHATGPVCSFLIFNNKHGGQAPFHIRLIGNNVATLHTRKYLDCEARRNYKFEMAAVGCDGQYGNTAWVHVTVVDVNEYSPEFSQSSYVRTVQGGGPRDGQEVARVDATDKDCTPKYGDICKYEILTPDQPFTIDNEGIIRSTEPLDYERSHNHILSVVAYDCGMRQSTPVMVTIKVEKPCKAGWKGLAERVDYAPSTGPLSLFPSASLEACLSDARCPGVTRIRAEVALKASHVGRGCDRDTYSTGDQQRVCGVHAQAVDLLPSPGIGTEWTKVLRSNEGHESDQMFEFDGETTAAIVPESVLNHSLAGTFSVSTWMRHAPRPDLDKHGKEHILCLADDHQMNRHHYALFVRNCRLIFLLRRDFGEGDLNIFRPAEWRWKIPEVCDEQWHHYSLHVRFPNAELYVDGEPYRGDGKNPEVIDDWPLHPTKNINTTLTVGACWQGTDSKMKHYLKGSLAGLNVLLHGVEGRQQLKCVAQCREGLSLAPDLFLKSVSVEGDSATDVETLLRKVTYTNSRAFPTPGRRNVHIATTVTCDNGSTMEARPAESYIMVLRPASPSVLISGSAEASQDYAHFRAGVLVFPNVTVKVVDAQGETPEDPSAQRLDSCVVSVYPALNPDHETLSLHTDTRDVRAAVNRDGVILSGAEQVHEYQRVLREISYTNKKPAYYLNRVFKLTCSELNGRFTSNEYVQTLTVVHPHMAAHDEHSNSVHHKLHSGMADKMDPQDRTLDAISKSHVLGGAHLHHSAAAQTPSRQYAAHALRAQHSVDGPHYDVREHADTTNHAALLIGVICAGFLVLAAAVGLARARGGAHRHRLVSRATTAQAAKGAASPADAEMAWDDSALTITVNPMEAGEGAGTGDNAGADLESASQSAPGHSSDEDFCSDSDSDQHDSEDEEEEVVDPKQHKYKNINQLEWDNSTM